MNKTVANKKMVWAFIIFTTILTVSFVILVAYHLVSLGVEDEWVWHYREVIHYNQFWLPLLFFCTWLAFLAYFIIRQEQQKRTLITAVIICAIILGMIIQLSVFSVSEPGAIGLSMIVVSPHCTGYFTGAIKITSLSYFLSNYVDERLKLPTHVQTHPPGAVLFYWLIERLTNSMPKMAAKINAWVKKFTGFEANQLLEYQNHLFGTNLSERDLAASFILGYLIPFIGCLTVLPLYYLAKELGGQILAILTCFLFLLIPSVLLFIPSLDLVLTFVSTSAITLFWTGLVKDKIFLIVIAGVLISIGIFTSLAVITILVLAVFILIFMRLKRGMEFRLWQPILGLALGLIVPYLLLFVGYKFNPVKVFLAASKVHQVITRYEFPRTYYKWIFHNLFDFLIFLGLPLALLFSAAVAAWLCQRRSIGIWRGIDVILVSFLATLLLLDFSGIVRGEVGRIWMFLMPLALIFSAQWLWEIAEKRKYVIYLFAGLQFAQILVFKSSLVLMSIL